MPVPFSKFASADEADVARGIINDYSLSDLGRRTLLFMLERARQANVGMNPYLLAAAGLGALASWLQGHFAASASNPDNHDGVIRGQGWYRP